MENFCFNEVCGLPVRFDKSITEKTKWFALRVKTIGTKPDCYIFRAGFDKTENGWISTVLLDGNKNNIVYSSMEDVVTALCRYFQNRPWSDFDLWEALSIDNDDQCLDAWDD